MKKTALAILLALTASTGISREIQFNLSVLKKGEKAERSVWVVNGTAAPVTVKEVDTGCVCTRASFSKAPVQPGDSTRVGITFNAKDLGVFYKTVRITTSDTECDMTVTLRGRVDR